MNLETPNSFGHHFLIFCAAVALAGGGTARAVIISEDFSYAVGSLSGNNGGGGFSGAWAGSTAPQVGYGSTGPSENPNLISTVPGYHIVQSGTGEVYGAVGAGVSTRSLQTSYTGSAGGNALWFSVLTDSNNSSGREGLYFNVSGSNRTDATGGFLIAAGAISTMSNGTLTASGSSIASGHVVHLVVGQISLLAGSSNSQIQLWFDPSTVASVLTSSSSAAAYLSFTANFNGSLGTIGVEDYNNGSVDAFRMSNGGGNAVTAFYDVVVPEPSVAALGLVGLATCGLAYRGRRPAVAKTC